MAPAAVDGQFPTFSLQCTCTREAWKSRGLWRKVLELGRVYFCRSSHTAGEVRRTVDGEGLDEREMDQERFKDKMGSIRHKKTRLLSVANVISVGGGGKDVGYF